MIYTSSSPINKKCMMYIVIQSGLQQSALFQPANFTQTFSCNFKRLQKQITRGIPRLIHPCNQNRQKHLSGSLLAGSVSSPNVKVSRLLGRVTPSMLLLCFFAKYQGLKKARQGHSFSL